jgi:glycosyltransferase involved in cell wall biosynthesis
MKKILINISYFGYSSFGVDIHAKNFVDLLFDLKLNKQCTLLTNHNYKDRRFDCINIQRSKGFFSLLVYFFKLQFFFLQNKKKYEYFITPAHYGSLFLKNQITTIHDVIPYKFKVSTIQNIFFKIFMPIILNRSKKIITVSDYVKAEVSKLLNIDINKIFTISNFLNDKFLDSVRFNNSKSIKHDNYFLMFESGLPHKNTQIVKDIFMNDSNLKSFKLIVIGGNANDSFLNIEYTGKVSQLKLINLYKYCLAFIYPSLEEGFGIPLLESMSCNSRIIASNKSSLPEVCGDAAIFFNPNSVEELRLKIYSIINDKPSINVSKYRLQLNKFSKKNAKLQLQNLLGL